MWPRQPPTELRSLDACDFSPDSTGRMRQALGKATGLLLVCGNASSGRMTTLYAWAREVAGPSRKLAILEAAHPGDLPWATRLPCNPADPRNLPAMTLAALHAEPDILLVPGLGDDTVLHLALRAAQTRQLVLAPLTAPDPATALMQLVRRHPLAHEVADMVRLIVHQRLLPRLCDACRQPRELSADDTAWLARVNRLPGAQPPATFFAARGCAVCQGTGTVGQTAIVELLPRAEALVDAVVAGATAASLRRLACEQGYTRHLAIDGLAKAAAGHLALADLRAALANDPLLT